VKIPAALFLIFLFLWILIPVGLASDLLFFYEQGCPECAAIRNFLNKRIKPNYPVVIKKYEIHEPGNANLLLNLARVYQARDIIAQGTPAVFVGNKAFQGSNRAVMRKIEEAVRETIRKEVASPLTRVKAVNQRADPVNRIALPAVLSSAVVDSINPCACAVLVLLLGTILLASGRKRRSVLGAGFAFTAACFISYFLMGFGLFSAIQVTGIQHYIYLAVGVLAVFIGLWNLKESFGQKQRIRLEVPQSWQPRLKRITSNIVSVPGAFFVGFLISLFLLPCTSGPYVVIIGMLSTMASKAQAVFFLIIYNIIFIIPFVIITLAVGLGLTTTARIEKWRQKNMPKFHLAAGLITLALGTAMLILLLIGAI